MKITHAKGSIEIHDLDLYVANFALSELAAANLCDDQPKMDSSYPRTYYILGCQDTPLHTITLYQDARIVFNNHHEDETNSERLMAALGSEESRTGCFALFGHLRQWQINWQLAVEALTGPRATQIREALLGKVDINFL